MARFILIIAVLHSTLFASACKCIGFSGLDDSDYMITGKVVDIKDKFNKSVAKLEIVKVYKGLRKKKKNLRVVTSQNQEGCGYRFKVGKFYGVYGYNQIGKHRVTVCSQTEIINQEELQEYTPKQTRSGYL